MEYNASDVRNKGMIQSWVGTLSENQSLDYWTQGAIQRAENMKNNPLLKENGKRSVIVMDEVDGCGQGDRGGIAALIQVIKSTKTPIICICNDK
jgi:replication factor C subunit 1